MVIASNRLWPGALCSVSAGFRWFVVPAGCKVGRQLMLSFGFRLDDWFFLGLSGFWALLALL